MEAFSLRTLALIRSGFQVAKETNKIKYYINKILYKSLEKIKKKKEKNTYKLHSPDHQVKNAHQNVLRWRQQQTSQGYFFHITFLRFQIYGSLQSTWDEEYFLQL